MQTVFVDPSRALYTSAVGGEGWLHRTVPSSPFDLPPSSSASSSRASWPLFFRLISWSLVNDLTIIALPPRNLGSKAPCSREDSFPKFLSTRTTQQTAILGLITAASALERNLAYDRRQLKSHR